MKITKLKDKLCAWPWRRPWEDKGDDGNAISEAGYVRMDHDGYRWWLTSWPVHGDLFKDKALLGEFNAVIDAFKRSFKDRPTMGKWCMDNRLPSPGDREYNSYYDGKNGFYWFRMIDRKGDYNCYIHCYAKEG